MKIVEINDGNVKKLARFMADIKPEWWTVDGALEQLTDITGVIGTKGWMIGEGEDRPKGWLLCREYIAYSCLEIECGGYDDNGTFALEHKLPELMEEAEQYARQKGIRMMRIGRSSPGFTCHGRPLGPYWEELRDLSAEGREDYDWLLAFGFRPMGFLPNCYGESSHCILLVKELT